MKKKKVIACMLAAMTTLAIAGMGTGCALREWFDEKINSKDNQQTESVDDTLSESEVENETSSNVEEIICVHADVDYNNVCDECGIATIFEEVAIVNGEKATGNWYRFYNSNTSKNCLSCGRGYFTDGKYTFVFNYDETNVYGNFGLQSYCRENCVFMPVIVNGVFEFHKTGGYILEEDSNNSYYDVYLEPGKTFDIKRVLTDASGNSITEPVTFVLDENITVSVPSSAVPYSYRLQVVAASAAK